MGSTHPVKRSTWEAIRAEAARRFAVKAFRPGQRELIECVLAGQDAVGILPTGAGKSLCFQLPALFLDGLTVVVSPLIALMQDQLEHLEEADIDAARLDSTVTPSQQRSQELAIRRGSRDIVLLTPERLQDPDHLEPLKRRGVSLFVVDEAHCVSQWGHDFRPAYLRLRQVIESLGSPTVLALTATAPPEVLHDIQENLNIAHARVIQTGIERENLFFEVFRTVNRQEKEERLLEVLRETEGTGIVYAATVRRVNELFDWLHAQQVDVVRYHGQLRKSERQASQERFMTGQSRVIIATNAFGLGVDKPDVRCVVHWNFPASVEHYYQEAGRAGRDGKLARCVLLYRLEDKKIWSFLLGGRYPHAQEVAKVLHALDDPPVREDGATLAQLAEHSGLGARRTSLIVTTLESMDMLVRQGRRMRLQRPPQAGELERFAGSFDTLYEADRDRLRAIMRYGETTMCRMQYLREYFGEPPGEHCGHCDNCRHPAQTHPVRRRPSPTAMRQPPPPAQAEKSTRFFQGQRVSHARFGTGEVLEVRGDQLTVAFIRRGERRVLASYLRPAN